MNFIRSFFIGMGILSFVSALLGCSPAGTGFASVPVEEFEKCISDSSVVRLDVRTMEEYADGHIAGALHADVLQPDFETKAVDMLPRDRTIAVYCRSGRRSKRAAKILVKNRFKVVELDNGFTGWTQSGREVEK